jgi:two-component system alkaline phosphatase synthesis response regulator PhoP
MPKVAQKTEKPARVLVADDERHIARLIQVNLERQGYAVACVADGQEAIELLKRETFARAVLDLKMPHVDGYQVLKWIRTHENTKDMWVAMMTANADEWDRRDEAPFKVDRYIMKPFNPGDLLP